MILPGVSPVWVGSPNFKAGRKDSLGRAYVPGAIVMHLTEGSAASVDSWFRNPASAVSAHYLVTKAGGLRQYVREEDTAWHAGRISNPTWRELRAGVNPNYYTIGIEHEGEPADAWPLPMLERSAMLLAELHVRWGIPLSGGLVTDHHSIFAGKTCPGDNGRAAIPVIVARALELLK